jgi:glyoxylase-like metal-dependent hydrolase (beta-lactamase superfamily II)
MRYVLSALAIVDTDAVRPALLYRVTALALRAIGVHHIVHQLSVLQTSGVRFTVVIKSTPGHTPGHQSLFLKLANTGNVLLSGDLYHYPEEITYKKVPNFDTDREQTAKSREMIEAFLKQNRAQLWIQHDYTAGIKRKIAPGYYD